MLTYNVGRSTLHKQCTRTRDRIVIFIKCYRGDHDPSKRYRSTRAGVLRYFDFGAKRKMRRSEGYAPAYYGGNRSMKWKRAIFWQMAVIVLLYSLAVTGCGTGGSTPSDSQTEYVI